MRYLLQMRFWAGLAVVLVAALAPPAQAASPMKITPDVRAGLDKVANYLNDLTTLQADFLQIASTGESAEGSLYLERPKRLRIEYKPPTPILIVANGSYLSYVDTELKQVQHIALEDTPVAFLLRDKFDFSGGDVIVTGYEHAANTIRVSLVQRRDPLAGELTLVFSDQPMVLRKWVIVDAQGVVTNVTLLNPRFGFPMPDVAFEPPVYFDER